MAAPSSRHAYLKQKIYESDDTACFITRERILQKLDLQYRTYYAYDREARILADLLDQIDTPVDPQDVIVGRMTESRTWSRVLAIVQPVVMLGLCVLSTAYLVDGSFNSFLYFRF